MTVHDERPLTRREIRERERSGAGAPSTAVAPTTSRRAATASVTLAGDLPVLNVPPTPQPVSVEPTPAEAPELREPLTTTPVAEGTVPEHTLTRRELRALLAQQQAQQVAAVPDVADVSPDEAQADTNTDDDVAEDVVRTGETPVVETASSEAQPNEAPVSAGSGTFVLPEAAAAEDADEPKLNTALFATIGSFDDGEEKPTEITGSFTVPIEHLHITEELDNKARTDADASFDELIAQGVASTAAVTTTNALILPTISNADAGEALVTGSIDLPRSLGSTGQHPNLYDSPDVDRLFDKVDREQPASDSVPVRASSAISTHTSTRGVIAPQQKKSVSLPVVLAITAAALLVGVVVLLVGGFVLNIF
ncbi:hypothetical protein HQQ81_09430 [Microbacteriaceae bacterium VKM Ac-2854]|nr:hypothetical protein [Microbacteriaceae bacterium VKM Ac-2854]